MEMAVLLKAIAVILAMIGGAWSIAAQRVPLEDGDDPDRRRRKHLLGSYAATSLSILSLAAIGFL